MNPPEITRFDFVHFHTAIEDLPPSMASTALLPVLIVKTRLRLSCISSPVAKEDPLFTIHYENRVAKGVYSHDYFMRRFL